MSATIHCAMHMSIGGQVEEQVAHFDTTVDN